MKELKQYISELQPNKYSRTVSVEDIDYIMNFDSTNDSIDRKTYSDLEYKLKNLSSDYNTYKYQPNNQSWVEFINNNGTIINGINILEKLLDKPADFKKFEKYNSQLSDLEKQYISDFKNNYIVKQQIKELKDKFKELKNNISKPETKQSIQLKQREYIKGRIDSKLKSSLEDIAEEFRTNIETRYQQYYSNVINKFKEQEERIEKLNHDERSAIMPFLNRIATQYKVSWILKDNINEEIKKESKRISTIIIQKFINKMFDKLGGLLIDINKEVKEIIKFGNHSQGQIRFIFTDGSEFTIQNSIVSAESVLGTPFYRYPLTFHNIINSDGNKVSNPSELTLKKYFK